MKSSVVATLAVGLITAPSTVQGYAKYVKLVPNGGNVPDNSNIGHLDPAGETGLSDFGKAFSTAGNAWSATLCQLDTDGDGYTNGQELGDPCCTWTSSNTAGLVTEGVSDPSDATKTPTSSELKAGCSSSGTSTNSTGSGDSIGDVVGTVAPAGGDTGEMPPDDDEDDSSESAVLTAGASMTTISSVAMGLAAVIAAALAF